MRFWKFKIGDQTKHDDIRDEKYISYKYNAFLKLWTSLVGLSSFCNLKVINKEEFLDLMKYLGFAYYSESIRHRGMAQFASSNGWDCLSLFVDMDSIFEPDGTFKLSIMEKCPKSIVIDEISDCFDPRDD